MNGTKTVAERLRKIDGKNVCCRGDLLGAALCEDIECSNAMSCNDCLVILANKLADAIEAEVANASKPMPLPKAIVIPHDADGEPCWLDDAVWHRRRKHLIVAVSHKGKVCIRDWETRDSGEGAVWVKAEFVSHRKPDTQDDLEADVEEWVNENLDGYPVEAFGAIKEFLRRQRELMGGE